MRKYCVIGGVITAISSSPVFAQSSDCDSVLIEQTDYLQEDTLESLAWMRMINKDNYEQARKKANLYTAYFVGDYSSFDKKRSSLLSKENYSQHYSNSRETFKASLSADQVDAWSSCVGKETALYTYYRDITPMRATLVVGWAAPATVGAIELTSFEASGVEGLAVDQDGDELLGERAFLLTRLEEGAEVSGVVNGVAGQNRQAYQSSFFIPAWSQPVDEEIEPPVHIVVNLAGQKLKTIGYWSGGANSSTFDCRGATPNNMTYIELEVSSKNHGKKQTCGINPVGVGKGYCDGYNEYCVEYTIKRGCYVSTEWLNWYEYTAQRNKLPYSLEAACTPSNP
ncbi:hypothetical protein K3152_05700 [Qipengyuania sp. 1NDH17]|uniref:YARHG domain-containing protein n=1 Tax=Qipengyuania polymorpha TaxID=2867234 RepID=A0ABS7IW41_9SPHN|nr:hypothetical protein [Qipengyuania polymorpha]MBX7457732.1 hypothetical protein [Qipengyuania polymorpha]